MTVEDYGALWGEFSEVMHGEMRGKYEPKQVVAVGLITAINGYDDLGHPKSATMTVGTSTTEIIERPPDQTASGDVVVVAGRQGIIGRTWTILHYLQNAAVVTASSPSRTLPTIVPRAVLTRIDQPSYGGYRSWAQIRYDVSRRNEPDLASQGIPYMATRFRVSGAQDWTELAPARHRPAPIQRTTLASDCSAVDTTISLTASDFFPVSFDDSDDDEQIRVMIDGEIVRGWYHADGTLTGCTRGVEAVGAIGVAAAHLASAASVMLLIADVFIGNLAAGIDYEAQVAPVDVNGTIGTWVPLALLNFTAADLAANPAVVDSTYYKVEIIGPNYEIKWNRVLLDANGDPMRDGALYQVRRSNATSPSTDPGNSDWTGATKLTDATTGEEELLTNPYLLWPANQGNGKWFGIRTIRRSTPNLLGAATIVWKKDDDPPPRPTLSKVHVTPLTEGYQVTIDSDDPTFADRGFMELRLYEADDASGTNSTSVAAISRGTWQVTRYAKPLVPRYVQFVAADLIGNENAVDNSYWQVVVPGLPAKPWPVNGDFETLDSVYGTGVRYWEYTNGITGATLSMDATEGVAGTRSFKIHLPNGTSGTAATAFILNGLRYYFNTTSYLLLFYSMKASRAYTIDSYYVSDQWTAYDGGTENTGDELNQSRSLTTSWQRFYDVLDNSAVYRWHEIGVGVYLNGTISGGDLDIYIDDIELTFATALP